MYMIVEVSQYVAVASFSEAWIEIFDGTHHGAAASPSPPSRRRGLKSQRTAPAIHFSGRLLLGGVD